MEAALSGLSILLRYMEVRGEKIEDRFQKGELFKEHELDALRDFCQIKFRAKTTKVDSNGILTLLNSIEKRSLIKKPSISLNYFCCNTILI